MTKSTEPTFANPARKEFDHYGPALAFQQEQDAAGYETSRKHSKAWTKPYVVEYWKAA